MLFLDELKLNTLFDKLYCPICQAGFMLSSNKQSFICKGERPHCFDLSSSGYINFAIQKSGAGDSAQAVLARTKFLASGAYEKFAQSVCKLIEGYCNGKEEPFIIDAGCGQGYYTNIFAKSISKSLICGVDLSKQAVLTASKTSNREGVGNVFYFAGGIYELPFDNDRCDIVVNLFAPCAEDEFSRVLKDGGYLIVGSAGREHLYELKKSIYDEVYENTERNDSPKYLKRVFSENIKYKIQLNSPEEIQNLFAMTPYYYRTSSVNLQRLKELEMLITTVDFDITVYKKVL